MKTIIFTKSKEISEKLGIEFFEENEVMPLIFENYEKLDEYGLDLLKIALDGSSSMRDDVYIIIENNSKIIGSAIIGYNEDGWSFTERFKYALRSLSVSFSQRGKGISLLLIEEVFKFVSDNGIKVLKQSSYTDEGKLKLKSNFKKVSEKYNDIEFVDYNV